nr:hypothetical protein [Synechococcus sp. PCC 7336]
MPSNRTAAISTPQVDRISTYAGLMYRNNPPERGMPAGDRGLGLWMGVLVFFRKTATVPNPQNAVADSNTADGQGEC